MGTPSVTGNGVRSPRPHTARQESDTAGVGQSRVSARNNWSRPPAPQRAKRGGTPHRSITRQPSQATPTGRPHPEPHTLIEMHITQRESATPSNHTATKPHTARNTYRHARPPAPRQTPGSVCARLPLELPPFTGRNIARGCARAHPAPIPHACGNRGDTVATPRTVNVARKPDAHRSSAPRQRQTPRHPCGRRGAVTGGQSRLPMSGC